MGGLIAIFLGGGLGALSRYAISSYKLFSMGNMPYGTLISNALASLLLGLFMAYSLKNGQSRNFQLFFAVGFCGGFSTFSTFSMETLKLLQEGMFFMAATNVLANIFVCLLFVWAGFALIK